MAYALWNSRPRRAVRRSLPPSDLTIAIEVGDIFTQAGNMVVGTTDTFDTQFEDSVINPTSVQGQLLSRVFAGDRAALDRQINESLMGQPNEQDPTKVFGKTLRYPIGTVAIVQVGGNRYFLPAFTMMSSRPPAHVTSKIQWLQTALASTWDAISAAGQREPVHLPILGSNLARLGVSHTLLVQMIVLSFIAAESRGRVASSLTVWVHESQAAVIDMGFINEWLRGLCAV